jgi:hypothetical protein
MEPSDGADISDWQYAFIDPLSLPWQGLLADDASGFAAVGGLPCRWDSE